MIWSFPNSRYLLSRVLTEFTFCIIHYYGFPHDASGKESACQYRRCKSPEFYPWVSKIPWRKKWQPTPVFLTGESYGQRSLAGYGPQSCKELDTTKQLSNWAQHIKILRHPSSAHATLAFLWFKELRHWACVCDVMMWEMMHVCVCV